MWLLIFMELCVSGVLYTATYKIWGLPMALAVFGVGFACAVARQANE